jgi:uncharacterized protein (DUF1499 family)
MVRGPRCRADIFAAPLKGINLKMTLYFSFALAIVAFGILGVYIRVAPLPAAVWHVDPAIAQAPASPNFDLRQGPAAPVIAAPMADIAGRITRIVQDEGGVSLAGDITQGFATYVMRTRVMRFPDVVSIRLTAQGDGTRVEIFSRSRFGYSDFGVNMARVDRWLAAIGADGS